ncbi:flagellar hook assembly protein FlgD [Sphingomonas sp. Tas61C01]|uniref:flagellar hook assembly protein FlgD n=1 Tax=Sphingomonas sp. Tas61C01 TaxID=3458297 RepID=UPI00403ECD28
MDATTNTVSTPTPTPTASSTAMAKSSQDYNMFLKLLTTQMQNQDPLKPIESTEYASQLAQFSQVEQTIQQTTTLNNILAQLSTQSLSQATGLIGNTAQFASDVAGLSDKTPPSWGYTVERTVASLKGTVTDDKGKIVATLPIDKLDRTGTVTWNGKLASGEQAPAGAYKLAIAATDFGGSDVPVTITSSGVVSEVVSTANGVTLGVNGVQMSIASLVKLTTPSG